jgi:hypothetical protein
MMAIRTRPRRSSAAPARGSIRRVALAGASLVLALRAVAACSGSQADATAGAGGAAPVTSDAAAPDASSTTTTSPPPDAAARVHCALDDGADPVALCTQKAVLRAIHDAAVGAAGVASGWDAKTFALERDDAGAVERPPRAALAYAAAVARYHASAGVYGDDEVTALLDADLVALAPSLAAAFASPAGAAAIDAYADLRAASAALRLLNRDELAAPITAAAEAAGRAVHARFVPLPSAGGAGGAGGGGGGGPGGAGGTGGSGGASIGPSDGVIGDRDGPTVRYAPAELAEGAVVLLDMATLHGADSPADAALWQAEAAGALAHLVARGFDARGLAPTELTVGADADVPSAGARLTDVQAVVALSLLRAAAAADAHGSALPALAAVPVAKAAASLLSAVGGPKLGLWDDARGGYLGSVDPVSGALEQQKPARANALLFAAIHRANLGVGTPEATKLHALRAIVADRSTVHSGLLTTLATQTAYFDRVPASFDFADEGGAVPPYSVLASAAVAVGLHEQWFGLPSAPP